MIDRPFVSKVIAKALLISAVPCGHVHGQLEIANQRKGMTNNGIFNSTCEFQFVSIVYRLYVTVKVPNERL